MYARGGADTQIFQSVTFIPLETTKESLFGKIFKMEVVDDFYIISDLSTKSILLFNKNGRFHSKIDNKVVKNGQINPNFTVDRESKFIITYVYTAADQVPKKLVWFDFQGKIVKQLPLNEIYNSIASLNSSTLVYSPLTMLSRQVKKDSINYFIKYLENNKVVKNLLPFPVTEYSLPPHLSMSEVPMPYRFYYSGVKNNLLYVTNYNYNIYALNNEGVQKIYTLVFPQDLSLSSDSLSNRPSVAEKQRYIRENDKKIFSFRGVYIIGNYLYLEAVTSSFYNEDPYLVYNFKTKELVSLKKVSSSSGSCFLPLFSYFGSIVACDNEHVYSTVSSLDMFDAKDSNAERHPNYPPVLEEYFKTQTPKSNPVLVLLKPTENRQ